MIALALVGAFLLGLAAGGAFATWITLRAALTQLATRQEAERAMREAAQGGRR